MIFFNNYNPYKLTALTRKTLSAPVKTLVAKNYLHKGQTILDFGCGNGFDTVELQKQGYNAMVDEASVGGQNGWRKEGYDPLIIFDSSVLTKDNTKSISANAEKRYQRKDTNWSRKVNSGKNKSAYWSAI